MNGVNVSKTISFNKFIRNTIVMSMTIITFLFVLYGMYIQSSSIEKSIENDSVLLTNLVFQNLYTVMKNGGTRETIEKVVVDLEKSMPNDVSIKIIKPPFLNTNKILENVFITGESDIIRNDKNIKFASPVVFQRECISCHTSSHIGDTAAIVLIKYPILNLQISLKEILIMLGILFLLIITVFFSIWYIFLRKYFVLPIKSLVQQIKQISSHNDLENKVFIDSSIKEVKLIEDVFNRQNQELITSYNKLERISNTDSLTGIFNRKKFEEYAFLLLNDSKRYNYDFSLLLIDLNKFKHINDSYGHQVGDGILIFFTTIISTLIRESDYLFRTGGDEFILLLPHTNIYQANIVIKKIKKELEAKQYTHNKIVLKISASFGISEYKVDSESIDQLIKVADERMYLDKKNYQ